MSTPGVSPCDSSGNYTASTGANSLCIDDGTPGAPIALINDQGSSTAAYAYDPYGAATTNPNSAVAQNPYTFAGNGVRDRTTGWIHYVARYYSARTGTFTQQDSMDAPLDATNANRYAYAGGDPINNTDPTGLWTRGGGKAAKVNRGFIGPNGVDPFDCAIAGVSYVGASFSFAGAAVGHASIGGAGAGLGLTGADLGLLAIGATAARSCSGY